jgi:hypothetical protein
LRIWLIVGAVVLGVFWLIGQTTTHTYTPDQQKVNLMMATCTSGDPKNPYRDTPQCRAAVATVDALPNHGYETIPTPSKR